MTSECAAPSPWWTINQDALLDMLRRAHAGEDPDFVLMEEYANSDHEDVDDGA